MFEISEVLRKEAVSANAAGWLAELPGLAAGLAEEWGFTPISQLTGGTESLVLEVEMNDGTPAVLKLLVPRYETGAANEIAVLEVAGGSSLPELYASDADRGAMLMERLGRPLNELGLPIVRRHEILAETAARLWHPAPHLDLPTGASKAQWLIDLILELWESHDRPCTSAAVEYAVECGHRRMTAHDDSTAVLVHGDVHQWNTLQAGDGFKLVDPDGLLAEAEYDMGIVMREDSVELLEGDPWERAHRLAGLTGLDAVAIWEWGVVERLSNGLMCLEVDLQPFGDEALRAADVVATLG